MNKCNAHNQAISLMVESANSALNPNAQEWLHNHLNDCPSCRSTFNIHNRLLREMDFNEISLKIRNAHSSHSFSPTTSMKYMNKRRTSRITQLAAGILMVSIVFVFLVVSILEIYLISKNTNEPSLGGATKEMITFSASPDNENSILQVSSSQNQIIVYEVKRGDSLLSISEEFHISPESILLSNQDTLHDDPYQIKPGIHIYIPPTEGIVFLVEKPISLIDLAFLFNVDLKVILNWPGNFPDGVNAEALTEIKPGTQIFIPGGRVKPDITYWADTGISRENPGLGREIGSGYCEQTTDERSGTGDFNWPINIVDIVAYESSTTRLYIMGHKSDNVYSTDGGVIVFAGSSIVHKTKIVIIDHGNGWKTMYGNLEKLFVKCGESVDPYQPLGQLGGVYSDVLLFEMYNDALVDPLKNLPKISEKSYSP